MGKQFYLVLHEGDFTNKQKVAFEQWEETNKIICSDYEFFILEDVSFDEITANDFTPKVPAAGKWVAWSGATIYIDVTGEQVNTADEVVESLYNNGTLDDTDMEPYKQEIIDADELLENVGRSY